jgi:hypothetical protein
MFVALFQEGFQGVKMEALSVIRTSNFSTILSRNLNSYIYLIIHTYTELFSGSAASLSWAWHPLTVEVNQKQSKSRRVYDFTATVKVQYRAIGGMSISGGKLQPVHTGLIPRKVERCDHDH